MFIALYLSILRKEILLLHKHAPYCLFSKILGHTMVSLVTLVFNWKISIYNSFPPNSRFTREVKVVQS